MTSAGTLGWRCRIGRCDLTVLLSIGVFFAFLPCSSWAQQPLPTFKNYTMHDGLPSSEVYDVLQDREGFMWLATDRGIAQFDGYEFVTFSREEGLSSNVVFELYEDFKGRIWYLPNNGKLGFFENGKIHSYPYQDRLPKMDHLYFNSFHIDSLENIYMGTLKDGMIRISKTGEVQLDTSEWNTINFKAYEDKLYAYRKLKGRDCINRLRYQGRVLTEEVELGIRNKAGHLRNDLFAYNQKTSICLYDLKQHQTIDRINFEERVTNFQIIEEQIFVGLELGGIHIYEVKDNQLVLLHGLLGNITVSNAEKDKEGGYWFTSIEQGVFYTPNLKVLSYTEDTGLEKGHIKELGVHHDLLTIGYGNSFQLLKDGKLSELTSMEGNDTLPFRKKPFFSEKDSIIYFRNLKLINPYTGFNYPNSISSMIPIRAVGADKLFLFSRTQGYHFISGSAVEIDLHRPFAQIKCVAFIDEENFWIGSRNGLFLRSPTETIAMATENAAFANSIVAINQTKNYGWVMGTRGLGVILYKDAQLTSINQTNSLLKTNDITSLYVDEEENVWIVTNLGLYKIDAVDYTKIENYSMSDGLASNEIIAVHQVGGKLYVGTKRGLSVLDKNTFEKDTALVEVKIRGVKINDEKRAFLPKLELYPQDKYLEVDYVGLSYRALGNVEYKYRILGYSDAWQYTESKDLSLANFADRGTYTLEIYARRIATEHWSKTPATLQLQFHPPFYKTGLFRILILALLISLTYLGFKFNLLSYNKHIQQEITNRLLQKLGAKSYLVIASNKETIRIDTNHILFVQSYKDYVEINTKAKKYLYRSTMKKMEERLDALHFIRVHRSYIVRKDKIDSISHKKIAIQEVIIPIGKTYVSSLKEFGDHFDRLNA